MKIPKLFKFSSWKTREDHTHFPYYGESKQPEQDGKYRVFVREFFICKGLQVNQLLRPNDMPNEYHSHPVSFLSLILWGGYEDEIYNQGNITKRCLRWFNYMPHTRLHKVTRVRPHTFTLVFSKFWDNQGGLWGCVNGEMKWLSLK